jgi:superkiller protein 3
VPKTDSEQLLKTLQRISQIIRLGDSAEIRECLSRIEDKLLRARLWASCFLEWRQFEKALEVLKPLPAHPDILHLRGVTLLKMEQYESAFEVFTEAVALNPKFAAGYEGIGDVMVALELIPDAIRFYEKAFTLNPTQLTVKEKILVKAWERSGSCKQTGMCCNAVNLSFEGRPINSEQELQQVVLQDASFAQWMPRGMDARGQALFQCKHVQGNVCGIYKDRPNLCRQYPQKPGYKECGYEFRLRSDLPVLEHASIIKNIATNAIYYGRYMDALKILFPHAQRNDAEIQNMLGTTYFCLKRIKEAILYFKKAIDMNPQMLLAYVNAADACMEMEDFATARDFYVACLDRSPKYDKALKGLQHLEHQFSEKNR